MWHMYVAYIHTTYVYKELIFINILFILRSFGFDNKASSLLLEIRTALTEQGAGNGTSMGHALTNTLHMWGINIEWFNM